jgi:uncharacterized protein YbjQ (UPF0145 family)
MTEIILESLQLGIFLGLLVLGFTAGRLAEKKHYRSIRRREAALRELLVFTARELPAGESFSTSALVMGSAVISADYFKRFVASLRKLFGGRLHAYESLVERARREAILRMKAEARARGATMVFNVKLETSRVFKGRKSSVLSVEVLAYGTAVTRGEAGA